MNNATKETVTNLQGLTSHSPPLEGIEGSIPTRTKITRKTTRENNGIFVEDGLSKITTTLLWKTIKVLDYGYMPKMSRSIDKSIFKRVFFSNRR